jgi:hypothetical protein
MEQKSNTVAESEPRELFSSGGGLWIFLVFMTAFAQLYLFLLSLHTSAKDCPKPFHPTHPHQLPCLTWLGTLLITSHPSHSPSSVQELFPPTIFAIFKPQTLWLEYQSYCSQDHLTGQQESSTWSLFQLCHTWSWLVGYLALHSQFFFTTKISCFFIM